VHNVVGYKRAKLAPADFADVIDGLPFSGAQRCSRGAVNANRENRCLRACSLGRKFTMLAVIHSGTPQRRARSRCLLCLHELAKGN
jgi:hypothetical protein